MCAVCMHMCIVPFAILPQRVCFKHTYTDIRDYLKLYMGSCGHVAAVHGLTPRCQC